MNSESEFGDFLAEMTSSEQAFRRLIEGHVVEVFNSAGLKPTVSPPRLRDAYDYWCSDLRRNEAYNMDAGRKPEIAKISGYLTYALRRFQPIISVSEIPEMDLDQPQRELREILVGFGSEYFAFVMGFSLCQFADRIEKPSAKEIELTPEFIHDLCVVLKFKNVSPHALYIIFKALFTRQPTS